MNKFLKKKTGNVPSPIPSPHEEALNSLSRPQSPQPTKSSSSRWKKKPQQKPAEAPAPQLDLIAALPSTDDFRTSLIMPSLSTRFSMLREQDDPMSLLGKASDDSVLQPRRKSRMPDFGFEATGLSDIAEVSSMRGSINPPFAREDRGVSMSEDGYISDADAHTGAVMGRSRPGEGNVLFGGRQKVYKIATSGANSTNSLGKLMYDDDVGMSAFQKYRHQREREFDESNFPRSSEDSQRFDFALDKAEADDQDHIEGRHSGPSDSAKDLSHSPSLSSYDKKRSTTSSDARSIARSSTAATSIASQSAIGGIPSPLHSPAMGIPPAPASAPPVAPDRTFTKTRRLYEQGLDQHLQEQQTSAITRLHSIQSQRAMSGKKTPPFLHGTRSAGNLQERSAASSIAHSAQSPPPPRSALPSLSTFGSVKHAASASPGGSSSPVLAQNEEYAVLAQALEPGDRGKATAMGAFNKPAHAFDEQQYLERQKQLQRSASGTTAHNKTPLQQRLEKSGSPQLGRPLHSSPGSPGISRSQSAAGKHDTSQSASNQFPAKSLASPNKSPLPDTHRTFFGNISASDDEEEDDGVDVSEIAETFANTDYGYGHHSKWQPTSLPSVSEHPALRQQKSRASLVMEEVEEEVRSLTRAQSSRSIRSIDIRTVADMPKPLDSPTLGPEAQSVSGMNGMVYHLRQQSNESSIYPTEERKQNDDDVASVSEIPFTNAATVTTTINVSEALDKQLSSLRDSRYTSSNHWDLVDTGSSLENRYPHRGDVSPMEPSAESTRQSHSSSGRDSEPCWQQELRKPQSQHTRDNSSATLEARDAFTRELAARRDAVKENLRSVVDTNSSRSGSPVPHPLNVAGSNHNLRTLGMLRSKTSKESLANSRNHPSRTPRNAPIDRNAIGMEMARARGDSSTRHAMPPNSQHPAFKNDPPEMSQDHENDDVPRERQLNSSRSANLSRSRSNSNATSRSRSRTGRPRNDLDQNLNTALGASSVGRESTPDSSPGPVSSDRDSDGSRAGMQAYFDQKNSAASSNRAYASGRAGPAANPYSENSTPPLSGSSPALSPTPFSPAMISPYPSGRSARKRTITKQDISEPTLVSSTSNVVTIDLPPGASLKNGMEDAPPIPPINPRRRGPRKLFGLGSRLEEESVQAQATRSDSNLLLHTPPPSDGLFPPSQVVRPHLYESKTESSSHTLTSPERAPRGAVRAVTAPMGGNMF
jgi:hypothetical protein